MNGYADEVRSLAGRTQHSTAEIRGTIEQLQRAVGTTVTMIEHSVTRAGESVERANQAGEALGRIKGAVNSIRDMNTQIAAASEEQSSVSDEITRNKAIATPHARLHQVIQQIIELKNQHKHEEAEALYRDREIEQNSEQVVGCIAQLLREMTKPER